MERESEQMQASTPTLCRSGCGFYGSPATDNLCSICYKEALKKKQQPPSDARPTVSQQSSNPSPPPSFTSTTAASFASMSAVAAAAAATSSSMDTAQPTVPTLPQAPSNSNDLLSKDAGAELEGTASGGSSVTSGDGDEDAASKLGLDDSNSSDKDANGKSKKKNRCATCRKKVGLTGFECRCGGLYCSLHRYSDMHECSFDYRELGAQEIRRNNPVVVGEKIQKI